MLSRGEVERLDARLASFAPADTALRLRLGQTLEVLCHEECRGGHFELGFSSAAAYALERCDRSVRWAEAARCLARRLEPLPELRRAMTLGVASAALHPGGAYRGVWVSSWRARRSRKMKSFGLRRREGGRCGR